MEIDIRGAIEDCTGRKLKLYYATIRGKVYISRKGKVCFLRKSNLVQSILYWSTWQRAIRALALEQFKFHHPDSVEYSWGSKKVTHQYWSEWEDFESKFLDEAFKAEVEIKELNLPEE